MNKIKLGPRRFVVCIDRTEDDIDLVIGKLYAIAKPEKNDPAEMLRLIDDSGEDYLYPVTWFVSVDLPPKARRALVAAGA
jgi:hypothetical protein